MPDRSKPWTTRRLLAWMAEAFDAKNLDSPRFMAELLLAHVLGVDRLRLYMDPDRPAAPLELQTLRTLVRRALDHEPVQYLTGEAWFYGLRFKADRRALIPRPSTQTIVERVLHHARATHADGASLLIADVCTGSGCIAVTLLKRLPEARAVASDVSADALALAKENADLHGVSPRLELLKGDLLDPIDRHPVAGRNASLDYLVSNPPYIPDDEWADVEPNVKDHEPERALRGGPDGMDLVRPLIEGAPPYVKPGGLVLVELAAKRAEDARALMAAHPRIAHARIIDDSDGLPRVVEGIVRR